MVHIHINDVYWYCGWKFLKLSTWKLVSNDKTALETFVCLSENFELHESIQENLELVTCMLYGAKDTTSVNKARYDMFRMGKFSDAALPPNKVSYNTSSTVREPRNSLPSPG